MGDQGGYKFIALCIILTESLSFLLVLHCICCSTSMSLCLLHMPTSKLISFFMGEEELCLCLCCSGLTGPSLGSRRLLLWGVLPFLFLFNLYIIFGFWVSVRWRLPSMLRHLRTKRLMFYVGLIFSLCRPFNQFHQVWRIGTDLQWVFWDILNFLPYIVSHTKFLSIWPKACKQILCMKWYVLWIATSLRYGVSKQPA